PQGVEPTVYGRTLLKRGQAAFDELKQGVRDIEFLSNPGAGEVRIGCSGSLASALLPPIISEFSRKYPRVVVHVEQLVTPTLELTALRERRLDAVIARIIEPVRKEQSEYLDLELLFSDRTVVAAGPDSEWAGRKRIDLAELHDKLWMLPPPHSWNARIVADAFCARGLQMPTALLVTFCVHLRVNMLAAGPFITAIPSSFLSVYKTPLTVVDVELPDRLWPVAMVTVKNRTLNSSAQLFIDHVRAFTKQLGAESQCMQAAKQATAF